jgi:secreted trypsin-like serine protease
VFKPVSMVLSSRIVGGIEANPHSWPWQVLISDGVIMCGATLISHSYIVTGLIFLVNKE